MNCFPLPCQKWLRLCSAASLASLAISGALAQSTSAPEEPTPPERRRAPARIADGATPERTSPADAPRPAASDEETIMLSPFEVTADARGYQATNTMSGTRLNSRLEDIPAPISVVTKQQMEDMAAVDINDIFVSEVGTEGIRQYTSYDFVSAGGVAHLVDNVSQTPNTANRIRGFGTPKFAVGGIARSSAFPMDTYNIDAVEISMPDRPALRSSRAVSFTKVHSWVSGLCRYWAYAKTRASKLAAFPFRHWARRTR
jgi:outer membrane receptor protein involved in Fe transport